MKYNIFDLLPFPVELQFIIYNFEHKILFYDTLYKIKTFNYNQCDICSCFFDYPYYYCRKCETYSCLCYECWSNTDFYSDSECYDCYMSDYSDNSN